MKEEEEKVHKFNQAWEKYQTKMLKNAGNNLVPRAAKRMTLEETIKEDTDIFDWTINLHDKTSFLM